MAETVYLTNEIRKMLTEMIIGQREKILILVGERFGDQIYITNRTIPFEGNFDSVSLTRIPGWDFILNAIDRANAPYKSQIGENSQTRFIIFYSHCHPIEYGQIVNPGLVAWSIGGVPPKYESYRGRVITLPDKNGNEIKFCLTMAGDDRGGDDLSIQHVADRWRLIEYHLFVRPAPHTAGRRFSRNLDDIAVDCYKYDPEMILGKIRKVNIAQRDLSESDLVKTILKPGPLTENDPDTGKMVLAYR